MDSLTIKLLEETFSAEMRSARWWLIGVATLGFLADMFLISRLPPAVQSENYKLVLVSCALFALFFVLWILSHKKPRLCLIFALVLFWGIQVATIAINPSSAFSGIGIFVKIVFTLALIEGIRAASRAEALRNKLSQVVG